MKLVVRFIVVVLCVPLIGIPGGQLSAAELADTIEQVKPSIVGIGTYMPTRRPPHRLLGTGFVVGEGRLVLTNNHVISLDLDEAKGERLAVFAGHGRNPLRLSAKVVAKDEAHDIAVLSIPESLPALQLATNSGIREGDLVAFTGFPIGAVLGLYPVTHRGIIASITPVAIPSSSSKLLSPQKIKRLRKPFPVYQLDATAYPGNSGSPLFLPDSGAVIGILNMVHVKATKEDVLSKPSGISFAIPIEHAVNAMSRVK
ncbi:MAG: serine protease [Motiliproteus sp.]